MKMLQLIDCLISTEDTDGISSHSADYAPMCFPVFKG